MIAVLFLSFLFLPFFSLHSAEDPSHTPSICLIVRDEFRGERELAERIRIASENLHWNVDICALSNAINSDRSYDWTLTLVPERIFNSMENNYLILFDPEHHYFESDGHLKEEYTGYSGYVATYPNRDLLLEDVNEQQKRLYPGSWYPTVQYQPYRRVTPNHLFYIIGTWGDRHSHSRYQIVQHHLAKKKYTRLFGDLYFGKIYGAAFHGAIPYNGETVIERIAEAGVCLVLHSATHLKYAIPSGRIFEAAAASAVIITDQNPFVREHFGDAVLYVDQNLSGQEIFVQIDTHMVWIQNHPEEALEMAKRAHQIFEERFLLEQQLLQFDQFHRSSL